MLTNRQKEVYLAIKNFIEENKYSPSIRELCKILGVNSPATMHCNLKRIKKKGYIDWQKGIYRSLVIVKDLDC